MKSVNILLIEDNEGDIVLTQEAFEESKLANELTVIRDGAKAISFFENIPNLAALPDLVLLDINLPKKSGQEVLKFIKNSNLAKHIPMFMLTTSSAESDIKMSLKNFADSYLIKPLVVEDFLKEVIKTRNLWLHILTNN